MAFMAFNKTFDSTTPDDLRINTAVLLEVEAFRLDLVGQTTIHRLGQVVVVNAVTESVDRVVNAIFSAAGPLVACTRHYFASPRWIGPARSRSQPSMSAVYAPTCRHFLILERAFYRGGRAAVTAPVTARTVAQAPRHQARGTGQH